jgi:hypothetical protein
MKGDQSFVENLEAHARQHVDANNFRFNGTDPSDMGCIYGDFFQGPGYLYKESRTYIKTKHVEIIDEILKILETL